MQVTYKTNNFISIDKGENDPQLLFWGSFDHFMHQSLQHVHHVPTQWYPYMFE